MSEADDKLNQVEQMKTEIGNRLVQLAVMFKIQEADAYTRYHFLDQIWWVVEGFLAKLLPSGPESKSIYSDFQNLRYRIHDLLSAEMRNRPTLTAELMRSPKKQ